MDIEKLSTALTSIPDKIDALTAAVKGMGSAPASSGSSGSQTPVSGVSGTTGAMGGSASTGTTTAPATAPSGAIPNIAPPKGYGKMLFSENFAGGVSWRTGGPTDAGFRAGKGACDPLMFYGEWGGGDVGMVIGGSDAFIVNLTTPAIQKMNLPPLIATDGGGKGVWLNTVRTPLALKQAGVTQPWVAPLLTWQHSLGVKPPFYMECTAVFPKVPGAWPAIWLVGAERYAAAGKDGGPYVEIDIAEFYGKYPQHMIHALHWSDASGGLPMTFDPASFSGPRNMGDFTAGYHVFGCLALPDGSVQFFIDGKPTWKGQFGAGANWNQYFYPILSAGTGTSGNDAGTPDASAPDSFAVQYTNLRIWGADDGSTPALFRNGI